MEKQLANERKQAERAAAMELRHALKLQKIALTNKKLFLKLPKNSINKSSNKPKPPSKPLKNKLKPISKMLKPHKKPLKNKPNLPKKPLNLTPTPNPSIPIALPVVNSISGADAILHTKHPSSIWMMNNT